MNSELKKLRQQIVEKIDKTFGDDYYSVDKEEKERRDLIVRELQDELKQFDNI